jgi:hypothetical protein
VSTPVTDLSTQALPWQVEFCRLSAQLAATDLPKLSTEELQREVRDFSPDRPEGISHP